MTPKPNTPPDEWAAFSSAPGGAAAKGIVHGEAEHARITGLLAKATQAIARHASPAEINMVLLEFSGYTLNHFREEEKLMESCAYPDEEIEVHKQEHEEMVVYVRGLLDVHSKQEALQNAVEVLTFWLDTHLRIVDGHFYEFLRRKAQ